MAVDRRRKTQKPVLDKAVIEKQPRKREVSRGGEQGVPIVCLKDIIVKKNRLTFNNQVQAVPACYRDPGMIAMLNLDEEDVLIKKGNMVATYQRVQVKKPSTEGIKNIQGSEGPTKEEVVSNMVFALKIEDNELLKANPTAKQQVLKLIKE